MARSLPDEVVAVGGDLSAGRLLNAYRQGIFPMHLPVRGGAPLLCWWSPDPRAVITVDDFVLTRSLRRAQAAYSITVDRAFDEVVAGCADPERPHGWINDEIHTAYADLYRRGHAHSVEAWDDEGLAGGLYGVAIGGLFAGESMFFRRRDASKAALVGLIGLLAAAGPGRLVDCQWMTPHLASLGAHEVSRRTYKALLAAALALGDADWSAAASE